MRKRLMTLCLAAILIFSMEMETLYAMENVQSIQLYGTGLETAGGQEGNLRAAALEDDAGTSTPGGETEGPGDEGAVGGGENTGEEGTGEGNGNTGEETPGTGGNEGGEETPGTGGNEGGEETPEQPDNGSEVAQTEYTVVFDFAGGTVIGIPGTSVEMKVKEGTILTSQEIPTPEKTGYKFQCWVNEAGIQYDLANPQPIQSNMKWTAYWVPITYTIKFTAGTGTGVMAPQTFRYGEEKALPANAFTRQGYVFNGWKCTIAGVARTYLNGASILNLSSQDGATITFKATWVRGAYTIRYNANGGTGTMNDVTAKYGKTKTLTGNKFKRTGYTFAGWNTKSDGTGTSYANKETVVSLTDVSGGTVVLYAMWSGNPYKIKYDGNGATSGTMADSSHVYGTASSLSKNKFKRKGFTFAGWNTSPDGKGSNYSAGAKVSSLTTAANTTVTLYAKWKAITYTITYHPKGGKMPKNAKKTYTANNSFTLPRPTRKGYDFDGWYKTSKLKKRIGEIQKGDTGNLNLYAKWTKCTQKATSGSAKITSCKATGTGKVTVKATIKKRVASSDDYYYLVYLNPMTQKAYKAAAKTYKKKSITFSLKTAENQGYVTSMFGIAVKKSGKYQLLSGASYVKNPEKAATNKSAYKPGQTKKGIQFSSTLDEVLSCDAKQNFMNFTVSMVCNNGNVPYEYNGKTYYFNGMDIYRQIVMECNKRNIVVTAQVMLDWTAGQTDLIAPKARVAGAAPYYSWNVTNNASREKMEAIFSYLGKIFGTKNCYISNWILGNEINNPQEWNYKGSMSENAYFKAYAYAFRALYYGVRSQYSNAHLFICMDNCWNTALQGGYSTKYSIAAFHKQLKKIQSGLSWNLAYHAYSSPLTYTNFWDGFGITNDVNTPYITMKNLNVLTKYMKKTYGSSVRIILSEQGYSSTWGEANQAAALAYSYYIAACNPMIDAFIIRSYTDHPIEVAQGLSMGISGKEAFNVFKYMDTSKSRKYTKKYLGMLGATSWKKIVPGYTAKRIRSMYRKT